MQLEVRDNVGAHAFAGILDAARAWFRQHNRRSFCYLEEEGELMPDGADIKLMSRAMMSRAQNAGSPRRSASSRA